MSHDQYPADDLPEVTTLTPEQANKGYKLGPTEVVAIDATPDPMLASRSYDVGNGVQVNGQAVARVIVGSDSDRAEALVVNTGDQTLMMLERGDDEDSLVARLTPGEPWAIGRTFEGQGNLPDSVSGDHCEVSVDDKANWSSEIISQQITQLFKGSEDKTAII